MNRKILELREVTRDFASGNEVLNVLRGVDLQIKQGEMVGLIGPSGAGKSTLLQIAGMLENPTSGKILFAGKSVGKISDKKRTILRRNSIGFVYQYHHLLPEFSALENVILPQLIAGESKRNANKKALELLTMVGLEERLSHRPAQLSGGEQQRVAIARALANSPRLLLADEPTGNLDHQTSDHVFDLLIETIRQTGLSALIATHNIELAHRMDRILEIRDGRLHEISLEDAGTMA